MSITARPPLPTAVWELVTPDMAERYLGLNTHNRRVRRRVVETYAREMRAGRWHRDGSPIQFSETRMLNGQHRMMAIIESNKPQWMLIIRGVDDAAFQSMDQGARRTNGQLLGMAGIKNGTNMGAAVTLVHWILEGAPKTWRGMTAAEQLDWLEANPDFFACYDAMPHKTCKFITPSILIAMHYLMSASDEELARTFFDQLVTGENLRAKDPILLLRKRLQDNAMSRAKLGSEYIAALFIKTWNAKILGQNMTSLAWKHMGDSPEKFPRIK